MTRQITPADLRLELDPESVREAKHGRRRAQVTKLKRFRAFLGDEEIGSVERAMETFENRTPGRVWVNYRWQSPRWRCDLKGERYNRSIYETKKGAVEALCWWFNTREKQRAEEAASS